MKKLFSTANQYIQESDWKIVALLKFCLLSLGIMLGMLVKPQYKKPVYLGCITVFVATYVPLMTKLVLLFLRKDEA